ncbi:NUDIX hydrolase [Microbacterium sp. X-17]|uniref:NUDIX hydrolase n=1 Tax=Microbacterium sp. X-17 TaxID=3144404 RepID=UPI0031F5913B
MSADLRDETVSPEIVSSDVVYAGRVWDVRSDAFLYNGERIVRQYVAHPGAAAIVAVDADDRMLLIQQYRHPIRRRDWEVPAGLLDVVGEEPLAAAQRELAEEADLVAATWEPLVSVFTTPGGNNEVVHLFLARDLTSAGEPHPRAEEEADIRVEWVPIADVVDAVLSGRMRNGILATGALAAAERLRRR